MRKNKKKNINIKLIFAFLLLLTMGFALLSTTLYINGTASIKNNTWDIHWDSDSVEDSGKTPISPAKVNETDNHIVEFEVNFDLPGEYYEFTVDAINEGTVDGVISKAVKSVYDLDEHKLDDVPDNFIYTIVYDDNGETPKVGDILKKSESRKYKVRVEFDSEATSVPETSERYKFRYEVVYSQYKEETPQKENNNYEKYNIGTEIYIDPETLVKCTKAESDSNVNANNTPTGIDSGCMKWYVIADNDDTVDILLDHNIVPIQYFSANEDMYAFGRLRLETDGWNDVLELSETIDDVDYTGYKARFITRAEVQKLLSDNPPSSGSDNVYENVPWLIDNTYDSIIHGGLVEDNNRYYNVSRSATYNIYGYYTSSLYSDGAITNAYVVDPRYSFISYYAVGVDQSYGIRPVIRVPKSKLS